MPTRLRHQSGHSTPGDTRRPLHDVDIQPTTDMPRDVAMQRQNPRIVDCELEHQVAGLEYVLGADIGVAACARVDDSGGGRFGVEGVETVMFRPSRIIYVSLGCRFVRLMLPSQSPTPSITTRELCPWMCMG